MSDIQKTITAILQPHIDAEAEAIQNFYNRAKDVGIVQAASGYLTGLAALGVSATEARLFLKGFDTADENFGSVDKMLEHWLEFIAEERRRFTVRINHSSNPISNAIQDAEMHEQHQMLFRRGRLFHELEEAIHKHLKNA